MNEYGHASLAELELGPKLYILSTIVFAENYKSWFKSWIFPFTFQAHILPHTLDCVRVSLFKFHI